MKLFPESTHLKILAAIIAVETVSMPMIFSSKVFYLLLGLLSFSFLLVSKLDRTKLFLIALATVSTLLNLDHNTTGDLFKDAFILILLLIPFCSDEVVFSKKDTDFLLKIFVTSGLLKALFFSYFIIRFGIYPIYSGNETFLNGISSHRLGSLFYEPTIVFTGVYFALSAMNDSQKLLQKVLRLFISLMIVVPWFLAGLRVPIFLYLGCIFTFVLILKIPLLRFIKLFIIGIILATVMFLLFKSEPLSFYYEIFMNKLSNVGASQKLSEFRTILAEVRGPAVIYGKGLGSVYKNPHYLSITPYTHSLFSYLYFKMGFLGILGYLFLFRKASRKRNLLKKKETFILFASCLIPLINALFFQQTYRYITFAIMMLLFLKSLGIDGSITMDQRTALSPSGPHR